MNQKPTLVVIVATLISAILQFFNWTPDPSVATDAVAYADQVKDAISMRNWANALTGVIGLATLFYLWLTGRLRPNASASILLLALLATCFPAKNSGNSPEVKVVVLKPLPRLLS